MPCTIASQIKILGALSVVDGREKAYPLPAPSQNHYLKSYSTGPIIVPDICFKTDTNQFYVRKTNT